MEGHLLMIDCEKLSCKSLCNFFFCINKLLQVATLVGDVDVSPQGFTKCPQTRNFINKEKVITILSENS
jgi:hypothetical protein